MDEAAVRQQRSLRFLAAFGSLPIPARRFLRQAAETRFRRDPKDLFWRPTLEQAHRLTDAELLAEPGCGPARLATIRHWLALHPVPWSGAVPEWLAEE